MPTRFANTVRLLLLAAAAVSLGACASTEPEPADPNRVSTIPWNRPEGWEGAGPLGGFVPVPGAY
jgi:hypothetical protein